MVDLTYPMRMVGVQGKTEKTITGVCGFNLT